MSIPSMAADPSITRVEPPSHASEVVLLRSFLAYHRATLQMKCAGLSGDQLRRRPLASTGLSLLGLVRHLTDVEGSWSVRWLAGSEWEPTYWSDADPDGDFEHLESVPVRQVWSGWAAAVERSDAVVDTFEDPGQRARRAVDDPPSLRWVLIHLVEEYARHNGHADLLRQAIDGAVGE